MNCSKVREELMEAVLSGLEGATPAVREHLASCETCAQELAAMRDTMSLLDEWQAPEPSPYFAVRLKARLREEQAHQGAGWLAWLRRPVVVTAAAALFAVGVGMLTGDLMKNKHLETVANAGQSQAVNDLQYLDNHADLFSDFDALDDNQTEAN